MIKDRVIRNVRNLSDVEKVEKYQKPSRIHNFYINKYIEYESNGDTNKTLSKTILMILEPL